ADHEGVPSAGGESYELLRVVDRERERFLDEHVLACEQRPPSVLVVELGWRGDHDGVDVVAREGCLRIGRRGNRRRLARRTIGITDEDQLDSLDARERLAELDPPAAVSQLSDAHRERGMLLRRRPIVNRARLPSNPSLARGRIITEARAWL